MGEFFSDSKVRRLNKSQADGPWNRDSVGRLRNKEFDDSRLTPKAAQSAPVSQIADQEAVGKQLRPISEELAKLREMIQNAKKRRPKFD